MLKKRMYQGDIAFSRRTNIKAAITYTIVAVLTFLLFSNAHAADANLPADFDKAAFFKAKAEQSFGIYMKDDQIKAHVEHIIFYMAMSAERQNKGSLVMTKIYLLATALDSWYKSFGIPMNCEVRYWQGISQNKNSYTVWALPASMIESIVDFWYRHIEFFQRVYIDRCKTRLDYDFTADLRASLKVEN